MDELSLMVVLVSVLFLIALADTIAFFWIVGRLHGRAFLDWYESHERRVARRFGGSLYILLRRRLNRTPDTGAAGGGR